MSGGLFALLDDVAVIAKKAAVVLDDVAAGAGKASVKSAALVVDDAAVTPQYITGIHADRELGIIKRIAKGSIINKLVIIIPLALLLSQFAEWALPILLIAGGSFLAFEGAEKVLGWMGIHLHEEYHSIPALEADPTLPVESPKESEDKLIGGAIRTDLILSAEIMLIALSNIDTDSFITRLLTLVVVAIVMVIVVYGAVALIIRMDDLGLKMVQKPGRLREVVGRGLVSGMPKVLTTLSLVGTLAMLWVGGHLVLVNLDEVGFHAPYEFVHHILDAVHGLGGFVHWLVDTVTSGIAGLLTGLLVLAVVLGVKKLIPGH